MKEKAMFAAGCFWGIEASFRKLEGVEEVLCGYSGGTTKNPTYQEVCSGETNHAEVVEVSFDPSKINFTQLLEHFWTIHDPTSKNRQGPDVGTQYRSAIFYLNEDQKDQAQRSKTQLDESGTLKGAITTEITKASEFYKAEDYHQKYFEKHGISCKL